ncbi:CxxCxxCC domain-containing protein [Methanocaldococcus villosus]|nr:hypothetical protein [Methanocaldococcus villosus]
MKTLRYKKERAIKISEELFPDELCERCGRCCIIHAYKRDNKVELIYCEHFDKEKKLCKVYDKRFEYGCLTVLEGILAGVFPKDCPYVKNLKNYEEPRFYRFLK